jgi:hypothetical protein
MAFFGFVYHSLAESAILSSQELTLQKPAGIFDHAISNIFASVTLVFTS